MPGKPDKLTGLGVLTLVIFCWSSTADSIFLKSSPLLPWSFWIPWKRSLYCEVGNFLVEKTLPCLHPYQWLELELEVVFQSACCRFASWAVHQFAPRTSGSHSTLHLLHNTTPFMMDAFGLFGSELDGSKIHFRFPLIVFFLASLLPPPCWPQRMVQCQSSEACLLFVLQFCLDQTMFGEVSWTQSFVWCLSILCNLQNFFPFRLGKSLYNWGLSGLRSEKFIKNLCSFG